MAVDSQHFTDCMLMSSFLDATTVHTITKCTFISKSILYVIIVHTHNEYITSLSPHCQ